MPTTAHHSQNRNLFKQLKARLILPIGALVGCFVFTSLLGMFTTTSQQQFGERKATIHDTVNTLFEGMVDQETGLRGYVITNIPTFLEPLNSERNQYASNLAKLKKAVAGPEFQQTASSLARVEAQMTIWSNTFADVQIARMQSGDLSRARSEQVSIQGKALFDNLRVDIMQLQKATDSDLGNLQTRVNTINMVAFVGTLMLCLIGIFWLWRILTSFVTTQREQLAHLKEIVMAFGSGDLSIRIHNFYDSDLRDVGSTFNTMASKLQEQQDALKDRDILEQVSQLNAILTDSLDLTSLMDAFSQQVLPLLNVQVAALYLYNRDKACLDLFTSCGISPEEIAATFMLGEGLIGQVAQYRQSLMITYPDHSQHRTEEFRIKTVMGTIVPSSLYHLPILQGHDLLGVLVIGSMYPMSEQTRNVLGVITSNLASVITNARAYQHIQDQARKLAEHAYAQEQAYQILRQQRDELTTLNIALQEANQARSRFLSTMSHELRTPLTSILGFGQMLLRTSQSLTKRQINNIERILKNAEHLLTLINGILDLAKVESGRMDVHTEVVDLKELLTAVVEETHPMALERGLSLSINIEDEITTLATDPLKLRQIVLNLLSNALKFTERGGVTITAQCRTITTTNDQQSVEKPQVAIIVKDTGIGIALEQQAHIFETFYQVDNSHSRNYGGTGLGLSIVREFTTLLGGTLELESQVGQGATFTVLLPLRTRNNQLLQVSNELPTKIPNTTNTMNMQLSVKE